MENVEEIKGDNHCKALKTRNGDHTEVMIFLKFEKPYRGPAELINALSFILQEKVSWTSPDTANQLLVLRENDEGPFAS